MSKYYKEDKNYKEDKIFNQTKFNKMNDSIVSLGDLVNKVKKEPKQEIVWNGIPEGSCGLITGVAKTGKTTFAENLALSISLGENEFMGYPLSFTDKKVCFISFEEDYRIRGRRLMKQISGFNETQMDKVNSNFVANITGLPEFLNHDNDWEAVSDSISDVNPDIIILDSLSRMCVGEIEKSSVAQSFTQKFNRHIKSLQKTTFVIHHNVKGNDKPISQDLIAGSRFISQEFEFAIGMGKIPNRFGGNYLKVLYNKYASTDNQKAITYTLDNSKIKSTGHFYVEDLYLEKAPITDGRVDFTNKNVLLNTIEEFLSQDNQGSQDSQNNYTFKTSDIIEILVPHKMSKDTYHNKLKSLVRDGDVRKLKKGEYELIAKNQ